MKQRVIANPPIGIYTNPRTHIGHAFFLIALDTLARYKNAFLGENVIFPGRSYNFYGKRGDKLAQKENYSQEYHKILKERNLKIVNQDKSRSKLNLSSLELLIDDDEKIVEGVQKDFIQLYKKGYAIIEKGTFYLDCPKIRKNFKLKSYLDKINFFPKRIEGELEHLIEKNMTLIPITKPTKYSPENILGGDNIGPLFVLSNMWDHKYENSSFTMAGSNSILSKYIFLRFLSRIALEDNPGMDEVVIWPKILPEKGEDFWNIDNLAKDVYHGDMIRHSVLSVFSKNKQKLLLSKSNFEGARNFVYLLANLRKPLNGRVFGDEDLYSDYIEEMNNLNYPKILTRIEKDLRSISREINLNKDKSLWNDSTREIFAQKYLSLVKMCEPFVPETTKLIGKDIKND